MKLRFLGAAGTVTGSRTLLRCNDHSLLVDCGMFQGFKQLRLRNWQSLELDAMALDAVVLTHAHLDHSGWLPALVRDGFKGPVYCTRATAELLRILLPDSGRIQEEDAEYANRKGHTRHRPAKPMYTEADAWRAIELVEPVGWDDTVQVGPMKVSFTPAGHILGAASVRVEDADSSVLFSGDLGRRDDLLMRPPQAPPAADHVVLESTYGDRHHVDVDVLPALAEVVRRTAERGGMLLIPAFAVGRSQAVLFALHLLRERGEIPALPVYLDSPMAVDTTSLYLRHGRELRVPQDQLGAMRREVRFSRSLDQSKELNQVEGPGIIVSASGMLTGGRVLHHLARLGPAKRNTVLFVGYQAPGTRGGRLLGGERRVKIHGRYVKTHCEIARIDGFSAHADQQELLDWLASMPTPPRRVWLNHGESAAIDTLRQLVGERTGWPVEAAAEHCEWDLASDAPPKRVGALPVGEDEPVAPTRLALEHALLELGLRGTVLALGGRDPGAVVVGSEDAGAVVDALAALRGGEPPGVPVVLVNRKTWQEVLAVGLPTAGPDAPPLALVDTVQEAKAALRGWRA